MSFKVKYTLLVGKLNNIIPTYLTYTKRPNTGQYEHDSRLNNQQKTALLMG